MNNDEKIFHIIKRSEISLNSFEEITKLANSIASDLVRKEVNKILEPLVIHVLTEEKFQFQHRYFAGERKIDDKLKYLIKEYLDEPVYLYSKDSSKPSKRYHRGSSNSYPSRLESFLSFSIERYVDEHIMKKTDSLVSEYIQDKSELEEIAKTKMKELLEKKIK
jgi:hypothetical protein